MLVSVVTAIYNRAYIITDLYNSLKQQTTKDFEWILVDDGSCDNIDEVVEGFSDIQITFLKQNNSGKHIAVNYGVSEAKGKYVFIVDSDDMITPDAIETISDYDKKYSTMLEENKIAGFSFLREFKDGKVNGKKPNSEHISDYISERLNKNDGLGDKAEVFLREVLIQYPFPCFNNEKFLMESYIWIRMAYDYKMIYTDKCIYIGNYLSDGLTKNILERKAKNPIGVYETFNLYIDRRFSLYNRLKGSIYYYCYSKTANKTLKEMVKDCNNKKYFLTFLIPALLYYLLVFKKRK